MVAWSSMLRGSAGASSGGVDVTGGHVSSNSTDADSTTPTFTSQTVGTSGSSKKVVVFVHGSGGGIGALTGLTIGGVSATAIGTANGSGVSVGIYELNGVTATSATIIPTFAATSRRTGIEVFELYDAASSSTDSAVQINATSQTDSYAIDIPAGGFCIGGSGADNSGSFTWTNLTKDSQSSPAVETVYWSAASDAFATQQTNLSVQVDVGTTPSVHGFGVVSWGSA